ncbi:MAG: hypothetical protein AAF447_13645 [Myxococcota bacterium]
MTRALGTVAVALATLCAGACGDDGGVAGDAVTPPAADAGTMAPDGAPTAGDMESPGQDGDVRGFPIDDSVDAPSIGFEGSAAERGAATCYDGIDNDGRGGIDCEDASCREALRSCCVGDAACCGAESTLSLVAAETLEACDASLACFDALAFGRPRPFLDRAGPQPALAPGGDGDFDSGLVFQAPLDLASRRTELRGVLVPGEACADGCGEAVSFGVMAEAEAAALGDESFVTPLVGLSYSGPRREVSLFVGGNRVARWPEGDAAQWALALGPDGTASVRREGETVLANVPYVPQPARVVAWGHSRNPGASGRPLARLASLTVAEALCDMPRAWRDRAALAFRSGGRVIGAPSGAGPSFGRDAAGRTAVAFASGGGLFVARRSDEARPGELVLADAANPTVLLPDRALDQPELVETPAGERLLYARASPADGTDASLLRVPLDENLERAGTPEAVTLPLRGDAPSVVAVDAGSNRYAMAIRSEGGVALLVSQNGRDWAPVREAVLLDPALGTPESGVPVEALGADAIGEPALVVHGGSYRLYVAWRRGSRWRVALFASHELLFWRLVDAEALVPGQGGERFGVRGLDARSVGDAIEVVYAGDDGTRTTLFRALLPAAPDAGF